MKRNSKFLFVLLGLALFLSCARTPQQLSEKPGVPSVDLTSEKIRDSIVRIESENASGTGFFAAPDKIATSIHVIAPTGPILVTSPDKSKNWTIEGVVAYDAKNKLVVLKIAGESTPLPFGNSDTLEIGASISIPGYPDGEYKVTDGSIQSIRKNNKWLRIKTTTSKETNGSPVLNNKGRVIGVIVPYGVGSYSYAMPSSALETLLDRSVPVEPLAAWQKREQIRTEAHYSLGVEKFSVKDYAGAIVDFDKAIELNPKYVRACYERGRAQARLGNYANGIASLTQVIKMAPEDADAYHGRGTIEAILGNYADAILDLDKAIELDAVHPIAYSNRGAVKRKLGKSEAAHGNAKEAQRLYEEAIADCDKALQIDPEYANAYNNRGGAKLALDDFEGAIPDFGRAIEIDPENADVYNNRGWAKFKFGESENIRGNAKEAQRLYEAAIEDYTRTIEIDSEHTHAYNNRGLVRSKLGESESDRGNVGKAQGLYKEAIKDHTRAIDINPKDADAYSNRGRVRFKLGESEVTRANAKEAQNLYKSVIADCGKAIEIDPENTDAYNNRGSAQFRLGTFASDRGDVRKAQELYKGAIEDCTRAIEINPENADTYHKRGIVKCKLGDIKSEMGNAEIIQQLYHEGITDFDRYTRLKYPENVNEPVANMASEKVINSVVRVLSWDDKFSVSSGFFVEKDKIATNIHSVAKTGPVYVTLRNEEAIWKVEEVTAFDVENDLVILKIAGEGIPLPLGDSNVLQSGELVVAVGYPGGRYKVTTGVIDSIRNGGKSIWMKVVISGGNSGGPALNSKGQVIGINTAVGEHYAYAMPSNALKALIAQPGSTEPLGKWRKRDHIRAHAYCIQGQQKYESDRYPEALSHFDISIQLNPAFISAYKGRGSINANLGNHEEAVADYNTVIRLNPDDAAAYHNRGYAHFQLGKSKSSRGKAEEARKLYQAAVEDWTQAIKLVPEYTDVYNDRGVARLMLGDYEKAIIDFDKVIQINPKSAKSYYNRGRAKEALGQKEAAQMDFQKAKELDPDVGQ